jgi:hypothetical protein
LRRFARSQDAHELAEVALLACPLALADVRRKVLVAAKLPPGSAPLQGVADAAAKRRGPAVAAGIAPRVPAVVGEATEDAYYLARGSGGRAKDAA